MHALAAIWTHVAGIISSVEFWRLAAPLAGAIIVWYFNERAKRLETQYQRKEDNYRQLVKALRGFYVGADDADRIKLEFLDQLNQAWLYCPDDVITKGYEFIDAATAAEPPTKPSSRETAMGAFVLAIRKDLLGRKLVKRTALASADLRHLGIQKSPLGKANS